MHILAFDTANETIAVGIGALHNGERSVACVAQEQIQAHRSSNTKLLGLVESLMQRAQLSRQDIACVAVGRGPGSFTGVRIAMATAKGAAQALKVGLVGVSSLDAVAWNAWAAGTRGELLVAADAMRKEVYPVRFRLSEEGVQRLEADRVIKADAFAEELAAGGRARVGEQVYAGGQARAGGCVGGQARVGEQVYADEQARADGCVGGQVRADGCAGEQPCVDGRELLMAGDALEKYADIFEPYGRLLPRELWTPTGEGLLLAVQAAWRDGQADPFDAHRHNPAFALPVYTRLSDAEENERVRLSKSGPKNLLAGVQDVVHEGAGKDAVCEGASQDAGAAVIAGGAGGAGGVDDAGGTGSIGAAGVAGSIDGTGNIVFKPLDAAHAAAVAQLEQQVAGSEAWNEALVLDELPRRDRTWWAAYCFCGSADSRNSSTLQNALAANLHVQKEAHAPTCATPPSSRESRALEHSSLTNCANLENSASGACSQDAQSGAALPSCEPVLIGYAGGWVVDGDLQVLKVGVHSAFRRHGIARGLLTRVAEDARELGARTVSLEVRASNKGAQALYHSLGMKDEGIRPRYYSDAEDALIMSGQLDESFFRLARGAGDASGPASVAGMQLQHHSSAKVEAAPRPLIFAIESSCDETAAAIVDGKGRLLADVVASQIDFHARFGGVVPEIASRKHIEAICGVCDECFDVAADNLGLARGSLTWENMDAVSVTYAPGLLGALVVGVAFAKGAAWGAGLPFIGVNHLEGHLYANKMAAPDFALPAVASLVSGGNTMLVHVRDWGSYRVLGETIDDAVGEAFDKVSKALGLGYPGGPAISRQAAAGSADAIAFPRAMMYSGDLRFSLSGLKTAVVTYINAERAAGRPLNVADICASFQQAVIDVQVKKAQMALDQTGARTFCLGGGVAANPALRAAYENMCAQRGIRLIMPPLASCGDNAGMIALVALDRYRAGRFFELDADAAAHVNLEEPY